MREQPSMRTPLARVRFLGSAHSGTDHFWKQRMSSVALVPLTVVFIFIVIGLLRRNHAAAAQILGSPFVAITVMLFVITSVYHMWLGMQVIIEAGAQLSLKCGGSFVDLNPGMVSIKGAMVLINSGGMAGSGSGSSPASPDNPDEADDGSKGDKM